MSDLITLQRAIQSDTLSALAASNPSYLASLIASASMAAQRYCHRDFTLTTYTEYRDGGIYPTSNPLRTYQFPVTEIQRIAGYPQPAVLIQNTDAGTNQRATVQTLTGGDVKLVRVASGITTTSTLLATTNVTIGALITAINALGGGWSATVQANAVTQNFSKWPQADLRPLQGAVTTFQEGAYLELYTEDIQPLNGAGWNDWSESWPGNAAAWRLDIETGQIYGRFPRGVQNIRIDYTAGYAAIPADVQEAVVQLVQYVYQQSQTNSALTSTRLGDSAVVFNNMAKWPATVRLILDRYVAHDKVIAR